MSDGLHLASGRSTDDLRSLPADSKPVIIPEKPEIARKPRNNNGTVAETNGTAQPSNGLPSKRKRSIGEVDVDEGDTVKRSRIYAPTTAGDEVILVDDRSKGTIVIDDD